MSGLTLGKNNGKCAYLKLENLTNYILRRLPTLSNWLNQLTKFRKIKQYYNQYAMLMNFVLMYHSILHAGLCIRCRIFFGILGKP